MVKKLSVLDTIAIYWYAVKCGAFNPFVINDQTEN